MKRREIFKKLALLPAGLTLAAIDSVSAAEPSPIGEGFAVRVKSKSYTMEAFNRLADSIIESKVNCDAVIQDDEGYILLWQPKN